MDTIRNEAPIVSAVQADALRAVLRGEVILPGDGDYDAAREVWNAMIDRRPAVIVRCLGVADVLEAVRFARKRGLPVSVRGAVTTSRVTRSAKARSWLTPQP